MRIAPRFRKASVSICALAAALAVAACDHKEKRNDNPAQAAWAEVGNAMPARMSGLRDRQKIVNERIRALAVPPGTEDATLTATITELQGAEGSIDVAVTKVEAVAAQVTAEATAAVSGKDKLAAGRAVAAAQRGFDEAAAAADAALAQVEPKVNLAEQIVKRLLAAIEAEVNRLRRLADTGGNVDFSAIDFQVGSAEFDFARPASKATLDRLVQFAGTCETLTFAITGHTSKEGNAARNQTLSLVRANAVKAYLVTAGVPAGKIARTAGLGATQPLAPEPDPGSPEEAAMDKTTLESLRRRKRRVNVEVVTPCATPAATQPGAAPPPGVPAALVAPTAQRPTTQQPR
jgi:outer membrane protein OmpA-like peptidoglycan-associated protein